MASQAMDLSTVTPLILTFNEAPNIGRVLEKLTWADRIVVIDSYSTDETLDIVRSFPQVEVFQRSFDTHATQWNYGLAQVKSEWVLSLDADYVLTDALIAELKHLSPSTTLNAYSISFKYCIFGHPLRGTLLPPRQSLSRLAASYYVDDGHTQRLSVKGQSGMLNSPILHDDRKDLKRWLWAQDRYVILEVEKLLTVPQNELSLGDKIRKTKILAPLVILIYCLILKGGIWDGWRGWYYAFQRVLAELLLSTYLIKSEQDERHTKLI
jgi:glycosyltransferase involved in cell wall biosynthesis